MIQVFCIVSVIVRENQTLEKLPLKIPEKAIIKFVYLKILDNKVIILFKKKLPTK